MKRKITNLVKTFDQFGESVSFTHQGSDSYRTKLGGLFGFATKVTVFAFTLTRIIKMTNKSDNTLYEVTLGLDLLNNKEPYNFYANNFTVGIAGFTDDF